MMSLMTYGPDGGATPPQRRTDPSIQIGSPVALLIGLVVIALFGWWFVVSLFDVPWFVGAPLSLVAGAGVIAWQTATRTGYLIAAALAVVGVAGLFGWWWVSGG